MSIPAKLPWKFSTVSLLVGLTTALAPSNAAEWLTDLPTAQAAAKAENKIVMIDFTGSDWCGWCIRLKKEVFDTPEFEAFAAERVVLVEADFPRRKPQPAALTQANKALAHRFHIEGYPTIIVLNGDGKTLGQLGYQPGGPQPFIAQLARLSGHPAPVGAAAPPVAPPVKTVDAPPVPLFNGAPSVPPPKFNDLVLKGISGPKNNRLAMINNKTLGIGESTALQLGEGQLKVKCLEIREDSVLVSVNGTDQRELRYRPSQ